MNLFNLFFDKKFLKFIIVGAINSIVGFSLMFFFYNVLKLGYWGATFSANFIASILSFFLNKNYTFKSKESNIKSMIKFMGVILVCYILAYSVAEKVVICALSKLPYKFGTSINEQIAMVFGMFVFTGFNYLGQRYFAFKK